MHPCGAGTLTGACEHHGDRLREQLQRAHNKRPFASQPRAARSLPAPRPARASRLGCPRPRMICAGARAWRGSAAAATSTTTPSRGRTCASCGPRPPCARAWPSRPAGRPTCSCPRSGPGTRRCPRARTSPRTRSQSAGPRACLPRAHAGELARGHASAVRPGACAEALIRGVAVHAAATRAPQCLAAAHEWAHAVRL